MLLRLGRTSPVLSAVKHARAADRTLFTFWLGAFANLLAVALQQQVCAHPGMKLWRDLCFDGLLGFTVGHTIVLALTTELDTHQHMRTVGGNGGDRSDAGEKQDAVGAGIGDIGKALEDFANLSDRSNKSGPQITA